ncbi:MAG: hypothetical protein WBV39_15850 [Rudaea sp.]
MTKHFHITAIWLALGLTALTSNVRGSDNKETSAASQTPGSRAPLVVTVDHLFAASSDPERLFRIFHETLGLPVE